ncbi:hypothetical protein KJA14_02395 [Patescibacteria group bacterium]|nr:hypothetical protein [Patescibacteria group bacterium]
MNQELTKETAKQLMKIEGEVRGVTFKTDTEYILKEKGEEDLNQLEEELEKLGYPIKYKEIKTMAFYPVGLRALSLLATKKVFNFDNEKIREMGLFATKVSLIVKLSLKYFFSLQRVFFKEAPKMWKKHWTVGELIPVELNEGGKYGILRLKNFDLHPIYCYYLGGYFCGILQMMIKTPKITFEETKCTFKGDEYHEYLLKWQ